MKNTNVKLAAKTIYKQKLLVNIVKISSLLLLITISIIYLVLYIVNEGGRFTITLDRKMSNERSIYLSEDGSEAGKTRELHAETIDSMDNISVNWLPPNLHSEAFGVHNGDNYIAYTFFVVNAGSETINYWYELDIDDIVNNLDEAIRVMVYRNDESIIYAKKSKATNEAEAGTQKFKSKSIAVLEQRKNFKPNSKDKFTIVVWIEGDDPECKNDLLGGGIKMHMDITEERVNKKK